MNDLVKRLRASVNLGAVRGNSFERGVCESQMSEAASVITAMQEEISALRAAAIQPVMSRQGFGTPGIIEFYRCVFCNHDARTPDIDHDSDCAVREAGYLKEEGDG